MVNPSGLDEKGNEMGVQQVLELDELCINTGDSLYGAEACRKKAVVKQMFRAPEYLKAQGPGLEIRSCCPSLNAFTHQMPLGGSKDFASQEHPLNVVKAIVKDNDGALIFKRPLFGKQKRLSNART